MADQANASSAKVIAELPLSQEEAKWIQLKKIVWQDPEGNERIWESAERKTPKANEIDGQLNPLPSHLASNLSRCGGNCNSE